MPLHDSREQRERWTARAQQAINAIEDLRREITVAVRQKPPTHITLKLGEADVHLGVAQIELHDAIDRMHRIG